MKAGRPDLLKMHLRESNKNIILDTINIHLKAALQVSLLATIPRPTFVLSSKKNQHILYRLADKSSLEDVDSVACRKLGVSYLLLLTANVS